jgi:tetratricopeptide (TPR) repeat protein
MIPVTGHGDEERNVRGTIQKFEESIELDPHFAPAYAALSESHAYMRWLHYDRTTERVAMAKAAVDGVLRLQPNLLEARRSLGQYYYGCHSDYDGALQKLAAAQQLKLILDCLEELKRLVPAGK